MEDNNIENNGFENYEDQGKYKSSTLAKKKADAYAKIAEILLLISISMLGSTCVSKNNEKNVSDEKVSTGRRYVIKKHTYEVTGVTRQI